MKKKHIFIFLVLILLIILSIIYIIGFFSSKKEAIEESNLLNTYDNYIVEETSKEDENQTSNEEYTEIKEEVTERMLQVRKLKEENEDVVGWLEIPNTSVNYPVLQGIDNEYYMTHNYKKEKSKNGSIFLDSKYDWTIPSSNLLIYGHNLNNGTMFQELLKYSSETFYIQHPKIRFTTVDEDAEYEIISVFKSRVYYNTEKDVFRYYYFINAETEMEYNEFVENSKKASLYNIDATAQYNEQLITLSTCSYHVKDGRFVVVGKKDKLFKDDV